MTSARPTMRAIPHATARDFLDTACDDLTRLLALPPDVEGRDWMERAKAGLTRSTRTSDTATSGRGNRTPASTWCWEHEQEYDHCEPDPTCRPEDIADLIRKDPTGEAVIGTGPDVKRVRDTIERASKAILTNVTLLVYLAEATIPREPTERESREAEMDNTADPHCASCARIAGYLETSIHRAGLCRWCYDHSEVTPDGSRTLPPMTSTREAVERKRQGKRPYERMAG